MKIAIDLQACQTPGSRQRGIGRYSLELAKGIIRNRGPHTLHFLLNDAFGEHDVALKAELEGGSDATFETYRLLGLEGTQGKRRRDLQRVNDEILNWRYACSGADAIHVSSVFEGWLAGDAHVTGRIADVPASVRSATLYDLIPLLFAETYLAPPVRADYIARLGVFQQLDLIFAISESARQDAILNLGILPERIVNIGAATSGAFGQLESIDADRISDTLRRHGLRSPPILYTGGIDHRKNIDFLLQAYAALPPELREKFPLAIVCALLPEERRMLTQRATQLGIARDAAFTGFIPDDDLNRLYNICELFVFPSLYEGFGLPMLEAMTCGACVIAANVSSMPEIAGRPDVLFDPTDAAALTRMMRELLVAPGKRRELAAFNLQRSRGYSWDNVARTVIAAMEESLARRRAVTNGVAGERRCRVAVISPLPPDRSGIADYSASMLPYWARYFEIELVVDDHPPELGEVAGRFPVVDIAEFRRRASGYEAILYHFGNSEFHAGMYELLPEFPGIVVMHDFFMSGLVHWMDATGRHPGSFLTTLASAHGERARPDIEAMAAGELRNDDLIDRYPVSRHVIEHARGIIFHSQFAHELLAHWYPDLAGVPNCVVPHAAFARLDQVAREKARAALQLAPDDLLVCAFGILAESKQNHVLLEALASGVLSEARRGIRVVFVGELRRSPYQRRIHAAIDRHPMRNAIQVTGRVDQGLYDRYLAACDIAVSLRSNSRGETSGALQRQLAEGCPTIVSDYAAMRELPDHIVSKVPSSDVAALAYALRALVDDTSMRRRLGDAARRYASKSFHPAHVAQQYADAIPRLVALDRARCAAGLVRRIGELVAGSGLQREVVLDAGAAISAGLELHPASARRLALRG